MKLHQQIFLRERAKFTGFLPSFKNSRILFPAMTTVGVVFATFWSFFVLEFKVTFFGVFYICIFKVISSEFEQKKPDTFSLTIAICIYFPNWQKSITLQVLGQET